jgi:hypothetical protein
MDVRELPPDHEGLPRARRYAFGEPHGARPRDRDGAWPLLHAGQRERPTGKLFDYGRIRVLVELRVRVGGRRPWPWALPPRKLVTAHLRTRRRRDP